MTQVYGKESASELTADEKRLVSSLVTIAGGVAGAATTDGSLSMAALASNTAKVEVLNNSTSGDNARDSVKQSAEYVKDKIRDTLGNGTTSSIANGIVNALADSGDSLIGGADYVADTAMALASCATGDSYCDKALSDLAGKNQAVADSVKALMQSETWSALAENVKQAAGGNQAALEATGGMLASIMLPGKKLPNVNVNSGYKISNGATKIIEKADLEHPIVQSRINVQNGNSKQGWEHVVQRHFSDKNASQFTISQSEVKNILQSKEVSSVPISRVIESADGPRYERVITLDKSIGIDKFSGKPTNTMTILTDEKGNLITTTPGRIK